MKNNGIQKKVDAQKKNSIQAKNANDRVNAESRSRLSGEGDRKWLSDEIRFLVAIGITILLTMCNFHYCMSVGDAVYVILHGLFGSLAYVLPFVLLGVYLFMIPNRGNLEAETKTKLCLLLFLECCFLFHFAGIRESQPFSPVYYFQAGQSGFNGGLIGGLFSGLLQHLIGTTATILIIFLMMLITVIILTERSAVRTMRTCAGTLQSLTGEKFKSIVEKLRELFEDGKDDFEYDEYDDDYDDEENPYENGSQDDKEDQSDEEDRDDHGSMDKQRSSPFGRISLQNRKILNSSERTAEFFNREFPFMEKTEDTGKKEPVYGTINEAGQINNTEQKREKTVQSEDISVNRHAETPFLDENWRKGFSSSMRKPAKEETVSADSAAHGILAAGYGSNLSVSGMEKPGPAAGQIILERDFRSLEEMGFGDLLQEKAPAVSGSIDDFIVYNGLAAENRPDAEDTYPASETISDYPEKTVISDCVGEAEKANGCSEADLYGEEYSCFENFPDFAEQAAATREELFDDSDEPAEPDESEDTDGLSDAGERAVDLTEHVILPEDGPVMRGASETESKTEQKGNPSGGIWKQDPGTGSRSSSGAVTFSSKPKDPEKKPVVRKPYVFPPANLLKRNTAFSGGLSRTHREIQKKLYDTLQSFGVKVNMGMISVGPSVTRYELEPEPGVKVSRIVALQDDIKLALAAPDIRIEAPIPGKSAIGIEVPNQENTVVGFRELIESEAFQKHSSRVAVAVGRDISGQIVVADLAKMPHLLIAGATGSGKSVCINTLIMSIIYKASPEEVKLVMVDPKVVELSIYNGIPHLLVPVVTDARKAANALRWAVEEMNDRYKKFADYNVRNIEGYNEHLRREKEKDPSNAEPFLYQMVIIVDELADLMMVAQGEVEEAICRLAQMARAAGIHLVLATQRPSVNVITGLIKANVPSRIAFAVSSGVDSRTIIDMNGAEKLLGKGDMLFYPYGLPKPVRVQGAFISDEEVSRVVTWLHKNNGGVSGQEMMEKMITSASENAAVKTEQDEYFESAGRFIIEKDKASIGALQRNFKIGFNRAARIMDQLAAAGVVGEEDGTKPRKILMSMDEFNQFLGED
ncbi:MAG: DNA translocase FtsK 4TM domain-containing protein [Lachnospiraceae bacterium]|nr:DNA translocase FtsK 4TM domain-containing protein [Lachnospiraceae bacterium]MDY4970672.1 DNA translocase FtsK 4TM domain-containing protein [Lachnospiraceae bacterium]